MGKIVIDTCVVSTKWFSELLDDVKSRKTVSFVFTRHPKMWSEVSKNEKLLQLFKYARDVNRLVDVKEATCTPHVNALISHAAWCACSACDDEHIFALSALGLVDYVFTNEKRLGKCRKIVKHSIGSQYCAFKLVRSQKVYKKVKHKIFA